MEKPYIHSYPAYLMVTLNHRMETTTKVSRLGGNGLSGVARKLKFTCELGAVFVLNGKSEGSGKR